MRYQFIYNHWTGYRLVRLCAALGVSRRGYCVWRSRPESTRTQGNRILADRIRQFHAQTKERYGAVKLWQAVRGAGSRCGCHRVARLRCFRGSRPGRCASSELWWNIINSPRRPRTDSTWASWPRRRIGPGPWI